MTVTSHAGLTAWTTGELFSSADEENEYATQIRARCETTLLELLERTEQPRPNEDYAAWRAALFETFASTAPRRETYFPREIFDDVVPATRPAFWTLLVRYGPQRSARMVPLGPHND